MNDNRTLQYLNKLKKNHKTILRIAFLNPDETIQKEITNEVYNISGNLNVNYQNGARRTCTITINNDKNLFPIGWNGFWLGQKFQVWTGLYLDEAEQDPYLISQGIFYILNPKEAYSPDKKTISIQGVDKWAYLDGRLFGFLTGTYKSSANNENMRIDDLVLGLLQQNKYSNTLERTDNILEMVDHKQPIFNNFSETRLVNQYMPDTGHVIYINSPNSTSNSNSPPLYIIKLVDGAIVKKKVNQSIVNGNHVYKEDPNIETSPTHQTVYQVEQSVFITPYSVVTEIGKTFADIILEYNTMLMGQVFYDREGYLRFEAISTSLNEYSNNDREIAWHFTVTEQELLNLELESKFDNVFNDVIVLGAIINGARAKARIQNRDPVSETSIDRIGIKTKTPYESDQYQSDAQCFELATYYAQTDMAMERSGSITTLPIYHLDVGQIVTISTDNNNMKQEQYLVTSISYNFSGTMSLNVTNLRYFSNWTKIDTEGNVINE